MCANLISTYSLTFVISYSNSYCTLRGWVNLLKLTCKQIIDQVGVRVRVRVRVQDRNRSPTITGYRMEIYSSVGAVLKNHECLALQFTANKLRPPTYQSTVGKPQSTIHNSMCNSISDFVARE